MYYFGEDTYVRTKWCLSVQNNFSAQNTRRRTKRQQNELERLRIAFNIRVVSRESCDVKRYLILKTEVSHSFFPDQFFFFNLEKKR